MNMLQPNFIEKFLKNHRVIMNWMCVVLIIFALNAFSLNLGCISPIFSRLCGILAILVVIIIYRSIFLAFSRNENSVLGIALIFVSFIMLLLSPRMEFWLISLPIFLCGFELILRSSDVHVREFSALSLGCTLYALFYILQIYSPAIWLGIRSFSLSFSSIIGGFVGTPLALGPSVSGIWILLTFLFCTLAFFLLSENKKGASWRLFIASIAGQIAICVIYILLHSTSWMTGGMALHSLYIPFFLFLVPFTVFNHKLKIMPIPLGQLIPNRKDWIALVIIFSIFLIISISPYSYGGERGKIVIYERGCEMNFDLPTFPEENEYFEPYKGFSVGALGLYLRTLGYEVEDLDSSNPHTLEESLRGADVLLLMNLNQSIDIDDLETIWDFAENGGGLLIFGEHTSMFVSDEDFQSGKDYLNDVLSPTGIRVNPDTADYIRGNWKYAISTLPHPVTRDLGLGITTSSVGASLNLNGSARPIIIGRYGFSDYPNPNTSGNLGNRQYEMGELLGDIIVAGFDSFGQGNVLVFGDTSYVLNSEVPSKYKLVDNSIAWLMSSKNNISAIFHCFSIILLGILSICYLSGRFIKLKYTISLQAYICIIIALSLVVSGSINGSLFEVPKIEKSDIAWIDHAHINQFDLSGYESGSIDGLTTNLLRNGYLPLVLGERDDFADVSSGEIMVIIAPTKPYTAKEASMLSDFVKRGGMLFICAGYDNRAPLIPVLESFDIDIGEIPLGSPPWIVETHGQERGTVASEDLRLYWHKPKFMEAYPVIAAGNYDTIAWLEYEGALYNLILSKMYGEGEVVLIGDSHFLLNENLEYLTLGPGRETKEYYQLQWMGNIELLRGIITKYKGMKP